MALSQPLKPTTLLTTEEFAAALGISPKTVRSWTFYRKVPFVRLGRAIRFKPETVEEIIARGSVGADEKFALM